MQQKIAVLEDTPETLEVIVTALSNAGFDVVYRPTLTDPTYALSEAKKFLKKPTSIPDVIVFDFVFTNFSGGYEVFELLRKSRDLGRVPTVLFSRGREAVTKFMKDDKRPLALREQTRDRYFEVEQAATGFLEKKFDKNGNLSNVLDLIQLVRDVLTKSST